MIMILNNETNNPIEITGYNRYLDTPNPEVLYRININFSGDYSGDSVDNLAVYAGQPITSIKVINDEENTLMDISADRAVLDSLSENCDQFSRSASAGIVVYRNVIVNPVTEGEI